MKQRLIIVSNRLPITVTKRENKLNFISSAGGLVSGLSSVYKLYQSMWVGWPGIASERIKQARREIRKKLIEEGNYPVFLSQNSIDNYYSGFSNRTIWPLFHYFTQYTLYNKNFWESYKQVNRDFCDVVLKVAKSGDIIWVHDYHLMLLPKLIREKMPAATIGFFLHIPFPSFEVFRLLPWREEILEGILGADLIGFHTYDYVRHFLSNIHRILGYEHTFCQVRVDHRLVKVDTFPMGIDFDRFSNAVNSAEVQKEIDIIYRKVGERKIIVSIDRLDYTKGILQRLEVFDKFLEKHSEYRGKVTLILVAVPSRTRVEQYIILKRKLDELVGRVNGKYGTIGWVPVWYMYRFLNFRNLVALYNFADVALVTPLRDGMNLISKEFIATRNEGKGVLILSEMAGASNELGEAIIVNPNNKMEVVEALESALTMPEKKQIECNRIMQSRLKRYNINFWARNFIKKLDIVKRHQREIWSSKLTIEKISQLCKDYRRSKRRLILLDYDGTLISFSAEPQKVSPDIKLKRLLKELTGKIRNDVIVISGRDRNILDSFFKEINLGLIAEHGVWLKESGNKWDMIEPLDSKWKKEILPILELYVDMTPGSFIEEKEYSLVWHYRKADTELALIRARELNDELLNIVANLNLGIMEGNKVIEIKNAGINKGRAVLHWLPRKKYDFILAIGDDVTDEDVFAILPEWAYSIKVGFGASRARYYLPGVKEVRSLLKKLV